MREIQCLYLSTITSHGHDQDDSIPGTTLVPSPLHA
jgi:hypothetical protein